MSQNRDLKEELEYIELQGRHAALADVKRDENPYPNEGLNKDRHRAWIAGYVIGSRERLGA